MGTLELGAIWIFMLGLNYYLITLLQWYHYSFARVLTKHHKKRWHVYHVLLPLAVFVTAHLKHFELAFYVFVGGVQIPCLVFWASRLDKKLVFTPRVVRFFTILLFFLLMDAWLVHLWGQIVFWRYLILIALVHGASLGFEKSCAQGYVRLARDKLARMPHLKIIAITGSFGKTSVKNYLHQMLQGKYIVYSTSGSVNTLLGLSQDINQNLGENATLYIAEAGARQSGDIKAITSLLQHHYAIITEVGKQHIEYFKTIENVAQTKAELLDSPRLERAFCYKSEILEPFCQKIPQEKITFYPGKTRNIQATLEGTHFELFLDQTWVSFESKILGAFNVENLTLAIMVGFYFGIPVAQLQRLVAKLNPVPHRLNVLHVNDKIIIDDGFNGNLKGMLEGVRLCSLYTGRKIIVTPGLVESDIESNTTLGQAIDRVFDIAIITGELNTTTLGQAITSIQKVFLRDKSQLESVLQTMTLPKDLILFANDAPNYI
ncbi:Mur ligase family protein [Helicobacter baculiformis]|uniref:Mur ligase family protein n=1 Tax=Helicobacter baculiformis TaxID=427351 RepID=A0ABV7ZGV9_9HELI|nr:UDP-N-acetylmuramoyl-tripeptide--D-alanyl-D-alanine ligase [Helicobacter baculiformis]